MQDLRRHDADVRGDADSGEFTAFYLDRGVVRGAFTLDRGEEIGAARGLNGRARAQTPLADAGAYLLDLTAQGHQKLGAVAVPVEPI